MNKLLLLSLFLTVSCASKKVQTVDDVVVKYNNDIKYEKPFTKENLDNQQRFIQEQERLAKEQEENRKKEELRLRQEQEIARLKALKEEQEREVQLKASKKEPELLPPPNIKKVRVLDEEPKAPEVVPDIKKEPVKEIVPDIKKEPVKEEVKEKPVNSPITPKSAKEGLDKFIKELDL